MNVSRTDLQRDRAHLLHSMHNVELTNQSRVWVSGYGAMLIDAEGRECLDALGGLWNVLVGHGNEQLASAAAEQMRRLAFVSLFAGSTHRPAIALAERLAGLCYPTINKFFFTATGSEANEAAFKTARYFWKAAGRPSKTKIIALSQSYHGMTAACMAATGLPSYWPMFEPRVPEFVHIDGPDPYRLSPSSQINPALLLQAAIDRDGADNIAAFIAEPVQAAGGTIVPPPDYWPQVRAICSANNVLLIADEVVTAFGRTGPLFALSRYGIEPDIVTFAKGITSGYFPLGGMGVSDTIAAAIDAGRDSTLWAHGSTNSAHPVGCAVALANLEILEREKLLPLAAEIGARLLAGLRSLASHPHVGQVRGQGLLAAVELVADKQTQQPFAPEHQIGRRLQLAALQRGMFSRVRGDIYQFAPPYITDEIEIDRMVSILADAIDEVVS